MYKSDVYYNIPLPLPPLPSYEAVDIYYYIGRRLKRSAKTNVAALSQKSYPNIVPALINAKPVTGHVRPIMGCSAVAVIMLNNTRKFSVHLIVVYIIARRRPKFTWARTTNYCTQNGLVRPVER